MLEGSPNRMERDDRVSARERKQQNPHAVSFKRIVDLSTTLYVGMPSWQTSPELKFESTKKAVRDIFTITVITQMHMHTGTHVDAPLHSLAEGKTTDKFPLQTYMGEGVVVDLREKKPGEEITGTDLEKFSDSVRQGDVVLLCTDWYKKRGFNPDYLYKWPYLGDSGCRFLIRKKVKAVGTEGMSIAGWTETVPAQGPVTNYSSAGIHNVLLEKDILVIEELSNLDAVLESSHMARAFFVFAPLRFVGVEAAPCRAYALII